MSRIRAYEVEMPDGSCALFKEQPAADGYVQRHHGGIVYPLVRGSRRYESEPAPLTGDDPEEPIHAAGE